MQAHGILTGALPEPVHRCRACFLEAAFVPLLAARQRSSSVLLCPLVLPFSLCSFSAGLGQSARARALAGSSGRVVAGPGPGSHPLVLLHRPPPTSIGPAPVPGPGVGRSSLSLCSVLRRRERGRFFAFRLGCNAKWLPSLRPSLDHDFRTQKHCTQGILRLVRCLPVLLETVLGLVCFGSGFHRRWYCS